MLSKSAADASKRSESAKLRAASQVKAAPQARRASKVTDQSDKGKSLAFAYARETLEPRLELLHTHVVHRSSDRVQKEWEANGRQHYEKQFSALRKRDEALDEKEIDWLEQRNAAAILCWANQAEGITIEQKVQKASAIIDKVWRMSAPDGKYTLAVQAFEHWLEIVRAIQHQRETGQGARAGTDAIEGLGDGWKAEILALQNTIMSSASDILTLGEIAVESSDLQRCITTVSESLTQMLEELELIALIEEHTAQAEQKWIQDSINSIASDLRGGLTLA